MTDSSNPIIADLKWALHSANLPVPKTLQHWVWNQPTEFPLDLAEQTDITQQLLPKRQQRLGRYFEALCETGLTHHPDWQVVLSGFAIRDGQRTLGEIDLVVEEKQTQQLTHLELALKFYLRVDQPSCGHDHHWMGPSLVDSYEQKLSRLVQHQIPMGLNPKVAQALGRSIHTQRLMIKGRLFVAADSLTAEQSAQGYGIWLTCEQLQQQCSNSECIILERSQWLTGPSEQHWQPVYRWLANPPERPYMVWLRRQDTQQATWAMIVPNDWDKRAKLCCAQQQLDF